MFLVGATLHDPLDLGKQKRKYNGDYRNITKTKTEVLSACYIYIYNTDLSAILAYFNFV